MGATAFAMSKTPHGCIWSGRESLKIFVWYYLTKIFQLAHNISSIFDALLKSELLRLNHLIRRPPPKIIFPGLFNGNPNDISGL